MAVSGLGASIGSERVDREGRWKDSPGCRTERGSRQDCEDDLGQIDYRLRGPSGGPVAAFREEVIETCGPCYVVSSHTEGAGTSVSVISAI
jgi:hypothetical protein